MLWLFPSAYFKKRLKHMLRIQVPSVDRDTKSVALNTKLPTEQHQNPGV